jgi:hypothetical protein
LITVYTSDRLYIHRMKLFDKKSNNDDRSNRTPWQCKKQACAFQQCIAKHNYLTDPVTYCRPYYTAYETCIEQLNQNEEMEKD